MLIMQLYLQRQTAKRIQELGLAVAFPEWGKS